MRHNVHCICGTRLQCSPHHKVQGVSLGIVSGVSLDGFVAVAAIYTDNETLATCLPLPARSIHQCNQPYPHSMEVSIVDAALPIEYSWDCPYIQQIFHGKLLVETVSYRFQDKVNIQ